MIDEKEKQDGMKACFDRRVDDKVERGLMRDPLIAYTRGFDDAIDWFKKSIWHPAKEKPILQKGSHALVELYDGRIILRETWRVYEAICNRKGYVVKWCYIEDLLPKGGEK
jgi:hypothetical protein